MKKIRLLQGPNLNLLGQREPAIYGHQSLDDLHRHLEATAKKSGFDLECFQSNEESKLIEHIHAASTSSVDYIIFNPAAYTHTSVALRDALLAVSIPFIELHISNIHKRESFRRQSYFSDIAEGVISGLGLLGYELALDFVVKTISNKKP